MSFLFNGAANAHIGRTTGNPANTNAFTQMVFIKRTAAFSGLKFLGSFPNATASPTTAHDWVINDPGYGTDHYRSTLQVNYATATAGPTDAFPLNTWVPAFLIGSGANITLAVWDGAAWDEYTVGQTAFVPANWWLGGSGYGAGFTGKMAHLRTWSVALTQAERNAERQSETPVKTANLLSAHSGAGGSIAAALAGQSGTAYTNGGGTVYDADQPTFASATPTTTLSGTAEMPYEESSSAETTRRNYLLQSGNLGTAFWTKQGNLLVPGAAAPPVGFGLAQRIQMAINSGGIFQAMLNLPGGRFLAVMAARRVDTDFMVMKHQLSNFSAGVRGMFDLVNGGWVSTAAFGGASVEGAVYRSLSGGWWLIGLAATLSGDRSLEFFPVLDAQQIPAINRLLDVCGFQYEEAPDVVPKMTTHKPTEAAIEVRTLTTVAMGLAAAAIGVGQQVAATALLLDNENAPWDQWGPVDIVSSNTAVATVASGTELMTDESGRATGTVTGASAGSSNISASAANIGSNNAALTVGTAIAFFVDVRVEPGWQGTGGYALGVYETHATDRFPTTRLFQALNQVFGGALVDGQSRMLIPVPAGVTVAAGQTVQVILENDDINGQPADLVGMQPFLIVAA